MNEQEFQSVNRRGFLKFASVAIVGLPILNVGTGALVGCGGDRSALSSGVSDPAEASWKIALVSDTEPGEPLVVAGTVYGADGVTPVEGAKLYVYHTDARGFYSDEDGNGREPKPRLKGRMTTDARGRYEFRTIRPAPYPGGRNPAHIHSTVSAHGYPERWIEEFWFEGDPLITDEMRSRVRGKESFSPIMKIARDSAGVLRCVRDIRLGHA